MPLLSNLFRWLKLRSIRSPFCRLSYVRRVVSLWVVLLFCLFLLIFLSKDSYEKTKGRKLIQRTRTSLETKAAGVTKETDHQYISSAKVQTWPVGYLTAAAQETKCEPTFHRLFPICREKYLYVKYLWKHPCFKDVHGVDGSDCSILQYLSQVEIRSDLDGLLSTLSHSKFRWMKERISLMWPKWRETAEMIRLSKYYKSRIRKKILFYLGSFSFQIKLMDMAGRGGPLGELVQWTDLIATSYILGHEINVVLNRSDLSLCLQSDEKGCASKTIQPSRDHDLIFTDINGLKIIKQTFGGANYARLRCKFRVLDSFGTEAEFNYDGYKEKIPGGRSFWANHDLLLQQFMTLFPHSPDNTFLGFVAGDGKQVNFKKKNQALIYGKLGYYLEGKHRILEEIRKFFEIHATVNGWPQYVPEWVINHGVVDGRTLRGLLEESKVLIGLGFPYEGPGPLEAAETGTIFLNPKFSPARNKLNNKFFEGKPTLRKTPYMEDFIGEPHVYSTDISNVETLRGTLEKINATQVFKTYLPKEFTYAGLLERVNAFIQYQDFCDASAPRWPPLKKLLRFLSETGESCSHHCHKRGLICEPSFFPDLNNISEVERSPRGDALQGCL